MFRKDNFHLKAILAAIIKFFPNWLVLNPSIPEGFSQIPSSFSH